MTDDFQITKEVTGEKLTVRISGDLNVQTAQTLEEELTKTLDGVKELILDFAGVEYISSAGLRALLKLEKTMRSRSGQMTLRKLNPAVKEVFNLAGFLKVMHIVE